MKPRILLSVLGSILILSLTSFDTLTGWTIAGESLENYDIGLARSGGHEGKNAGCIQSLAKICSGYATLMQTIRADRFAGKRVRLAGYMRAYNVVNAGGFWLSAEGRGSTLVMDRMEGRTLSGTIEAMPYEVVADIPAKAEYISFGAMLEGGGLIIFDSVTFDVVDASYPIPQPKAQNEIPDIPINLELK